MKKQRIAWSVLLISTGVFLLSAGMLLSYYLNGKKQTQVFRELETIVEQASPSAENGSECSESPAIPTEEEKAAAEYEALHEKNMDFWGWLKIDGTQLSYPVMQTPDDPEFYLRRDFEGNDSLRGVPFLDGNCFSGCGNYIIYGHNMKDGTMFASLLSYVKPEYFEAHPDITLNSANGVEHYTVMAAFYAKAYDQEDTGVFRYYRYTDLTDETEFDSYVEQVQKAALYDTGIRAVYGDQILTLSTCSYQTKNGRFVVVAVKS